MKPAVEWMRSPSLPRLDFPFEPCHEIVGERHALERRAQDELAGVEDERLVAGDLDELREVLLLRFHVDERVPGVAEHPEVTVDAHVQARRLHERRFVRIDADSPLVEEAADGAIGENHAAILRGLR